MEERNKRKALLTLAAACVLWAQGAGVLGANLFAQGNPVPLINQPLVPDAVPPGSASFTLTVNGTGFVPGSVVNWNGSPLATKYVSASQLTATVPASNVATAGTASVTVVSPDARTSNVDYFAVTTATSSVAFSTTTLAAGQGPAAVVTGDFNEDGKLDLALANSDNTVSILLGNGDGTFQPFLPVDVAGSLAADFNGDGNLDLAALVFESTTGTSVVSVALGNGDGTFRAPVSSASPVQQFGSGALSMSAGDFNGDGKLDLAVASQFIDGQDAGSLFIQLGNGDGTFQAGSLVAGLGTPGIPDFFNPIWVGLGDFNGDGKLDLAMTSCYTRDIIAASYPIFLGNGDGTFSVAAGGVPPPGNSACPASGAIGDFNGDGKRDLAAVNPPQFLTPGPDDNTVSILPATGMAAFKHLWSSPQAPSLFPQPRVTSMATADWTWPSPTPEIIRFPSSCSSPRPLHSRPQAWASAAPLCRYQCGANGDRDEHKQRPS